jgi:flagellar hook-associated protein 3 FlgL
MRRVSSDMANNDLQFYARRQEFALTDMQDKMSQQKRISNLRDDPLAAAHAVRYESRVSRLQRFEQNAAYAQENYRVAEGYMRQATDVLQRVRELAVQGGNGTFTKEDMKSMGNEVNELLNELVEVGNSRSSDGTALFSGDKTSTLPFRAVEGNAPGAEGTVVTAVQYLGNIGKTDVQFSDGATAPLGFPGDKVFWADKQQVFTSADATGYTVKEDGRINVDGVPIDLKRGDNVYAIIAKINDSSAPVKAYLDPVKRSIALETTDAHQLWLEDSPGGSVFKDLGVLKDSGRPPDNYAASARVSGGSMYDAVIGLRDALYRGDVIEVGGGSLGAVDRALNNVNARVSDLGAKGARIESAAARLNMEIPTVQSQDARETDLDFTTAATQLKMLDYTHRAALGTAGKILQPTLLDFLR